MFSESFTRAQAPRNLDVGVVLGRAFGSIGKHWAPFLVYLAVLVWAPNAINQIAGAYVAPKFTTLAQLWAWYARLLLFTAPLLLLFGPLFVSLIAWTMAADASRGSADPRAAILAVAGQLPWLMIVNLVVVIAVFAGFVLLVVPGVMINLAFYLAMPACAVERLSPLAAISRSRFLTRGQRWRLFGLLIIVAVVSFGFSIIANLISMMAGLDPAATNKPAVILASVVINGVASLFSAACIASAYVELVEIKGGGDVTQTAEVFA